MPDKITITNVRVTDKGVEQKTSKAGKDYAEFTVMWSSSRKNMQSGEREYGPTKFVKVRVSGFNANDVLAGINGGDRVNVTGPIEHFQWTTKDGEVKDDWSMFAEDVSLPIPRASQGGWNNTPQGNQQQGGFGQQQNFGQPQQGGWNNAMSESAPF